jgi:cobalt-zinc-cadmium efflux system outer membrane protein
VLRQRILLSSVVLLSGCLSPVRQNVDRVVGDLASRPYDTAPADAAEGTKSPSAARRNDEAQSSPRTGQEGFRVPNVPTDVSATEWTQAHSDPDEEGASLDVADAQLAAWLESQPELENSGRQKKRDLNIPDRLPGAEAPRVVIPRDQGAIEAQIDRIYPELPPLPVDPQVEPGPSGRPYSLSDLQRVAAANNPLLRQAVANVEAAKGNLVQAQTYPNPTISYLFDPNNNNSSANTMGLAIGQTIRTGGKQKLGAAAARQDVEIAELALRRARSDLSTAVRSAYFTLLVDVETLAVTRALARFTDDIYRLQAGLLSGALAAPYEPASLRAQAYSTRLAYRQAIADYIYDWKKLVATLGVRQLPLTQLSGDVGRLIPQFDYDQVLAYTLGNHTDVLTATLVVKKAQYILKLAQVTPLFPDVSAYWSYEKDTSAVPFGEYSQVFVGIPLTLWDRNTGNIVAAQAALTQAGEESHRVEISLTDNLAAAYDAYRNNLYAIEYYRRYVLPDLVRYYRGIFARRQVDPNSAFGDLVVAQQTLSANVTAYLAVLQNLWMSVVGVADFLQTDDLFQVARPRFLPELVDLSQLPQWPCGHESLLAH